MNGSAVQGRVGLSLFLANTGGGPLEGFPLAMAHRGFSPDGDENTLAAFQRAVDLGFSYLEMDVRTTADGHVMVFHDAELDRLTDATGPFSELTLAEARRLTVGGEPLTALDDVFFHASLHWPDVKFNIDVKDERSAVGLAELVYRHRMESRVLVASFSKERRKACLAHYEQISERGASRPRAGLIALTGLPRGMAKSAGEKELAQFVMLSALRLGRFGASVLGNVDAIQIPLRYKGIPVATPSLVRQAHQLGVQVHVWTVDEPDEMRRLIDMGVDGIISDRADLLAEVMKEKGYWPQRKA